MRREIAMWLNEIFCIYLLRLCEDRVWLCWGATGQVPKPYIAPKKELDGLKKITSNLRNILFFGCKKKLKKPKTKLREKRMKAIIFTIFILFITFYFTISVRAQAQIDLESGLVFTGYNDVRIPGDMGTLFSLKDNLISKTELFYRIRLNYTIKSRHTLSVLYAPLKTKSVGSVANDIFFQGVVFPANTEIEGYYKFNSYRLTYRYNIIQKPRFEFGFGFTAKIRDAKIALSSPGLITEKTSLGFVPIINFRLMWKLDDKFGLLLDGDALAAPQGRAEDVLIAATYKLSKKIDIRAGYRILEGGADNNIVYSFALFHFASLGFTINF